MRRNVMWAALAGLLLAAGARAQNPEDLEFRAEMVKKSAAFHIGEPIEVEISHASGAANKYMHTWLSPQPFFGNVEPEVTPRDGVTDLREFVRGWAGSIMSSQGYLDEKPRVQQLELNRWFRFRKPGHFVLTLKSKAVQRRKTEEEGGGVEQLTLESEPLAFDILPEDPGWQAAELNDIEGILQEAPEQSTERAAAMHRLALLDSPAAVRKLVEVYFAGDTTGEAYRGLNNASRGDLVIALLKEAMADPLRNPRAIGADLLAELEVRKELGPVPLWAADPERQKEAQGKQAEWDKTYNEHLAQTNALIVASLKQRTGKERAEATFEAWNNAERQNAGKPPTAGVEALQREVLETASELQMGEQLSFVSSSWNTLPHEELRPIVERLIASDGDQGRFLRDQGYEFLCRDWPKDCAAAILASAQQPEAKISKSTILLLPEAEHPELNTLLEGELHDAKIPPDSFASQTMAALVLRAGSRKLLKTVQAFLDQPSTPRAYGCDTQAGLLGYLYRFAPEDAAKRTLGVTLNEKDGCGRAVLQTIERERYSEELLPVAYKTLDSENWNAAASAALFLGKRGAAADEERLRSRLQRFWKTWSERGAELRSSQGPGFGFGMAGNTEAQQAGYLEQALVSALAGGENWKLSEGEKEELRAGCLTENCRAAVEGRMRLSF